MFEALSSVVARSGILHHGNEDSHGFQLSPDTYSVTERQVERLSALGIAIRDCLAGLSDLGSVACGKDFHYDGAWRLVRETLLYGVPKAFRGPRHIGKAVPGFLKVNLVVDQGGACRIIGIGGHDKHGLGYSALCGKFRSVLRPEAKTLPGSIKALAEEVTRRGYKELNIMCGYGERFYYPELSLAAGEFRNHGIRCNVWEEEYVRPKSLPAGLYLDMPSAHIGQHSRERLVALHGAGEISFLIPPAFMGSKGILAFLRNEARDERLEAILLGFISKSSLALVREHVPETRFVGQLGESADSATEMVSSKPYVLKQSVPQGRNGTYFGDDQGFIPALRKTKHAKLGWILQEEIACRKETLSWFERQGDGSSALKTSDDWRMRLTAHYVGRQLAEITAVARRDKVVRGAKDCVMLGTVVL
jgi:hypothetical protein